MRWAILSDIHANPFALRVILADIRRYQCDQVLCAGDIFGYYPWAQEAHELLLAAEAQSVLGNHDKLVLDILDGTVRGPKQPTYFAAAATNAAQLSPATQDWLRALPTSRQFEFGSFSLRMMHGTPDDVLEGRFYPDAASCPAWLPTATEILVLGHTHHPIIRRLASGGLLLNPGSVGQPRDGSPEPSWIALEADAAGDVRACLHRVAYDQFEPMARLREMGWPERFITALNKTALRPLG